MPHVFSMDHLPAITSLYHLERKTVWQTCDREHILVLMESGRCLFSLGNRRVEAGTGDLVYIPAGQEYKREPLDDAPATFTYFHFSLSEPPVFKSDSACAEDLARQQMQAYRDERQDGVLGGPKIYLFSCTHLPDEAMEICRAALAENANAHADSRLFIMLHVSRLLALASRENVQRLLQDRQRPMEADVPAKLREAVRYIRENYARMLSVGEVCTEVGISRQHLVRLFRAEMGMTPIQFINNVKILHAKDLIRRNGQLSFKEIAYELGFSDEHYFSRLFLHMSGETPSQFRDRVVHFDERAKEAQAFA